MPVTHLLQTEIVQSETIRDDDPFITTTNLQDDLNQIRAVIRSILGRDSWLDLENIKTIDFLTNWFENNIVENINITANDAPSWHSVIFNGINIESFLNDTQTLESAVGEVYDFYSQIHDTLNVSVKEIILPVYLYQFVEEQEKVKSLINELLKTLPRSVKLSILFNLTTIPDSYIDTFQSNPNFLEDFEYYVYCVYFYDPYEAKVCSDSNDRDTCAPISPSQAKMIKRSFVNSLPMAVKNVGAVVRNPLNISKIFDYSLVNVIKKLRNVNFKLITNFFNIYNGPYDSGTDTYNIDISKFLSKLEKDVGIEVLYLDDLVWLEKYDHSNAPTVNGIFAFNDLSVISSLFGDSIGYLDKVVQSLKASKRKIVLFYDHLDNDLSTFGFSGTEFSFNLSDESLRKKYIVFNDFNIMCEDIDEVFYEKVSFLTKNKHYILVSPGEIVQTQEGVVTEVYVVSDYAANTSLKLIEATFGEVATSPSLVLNIDASNQQVEVDTSTYSVVYDSSSYNFLKIEVGNNEVKLFFNDETTPLHTSPVSLQDKSIIISLENTDSAQQLKLYGIFRK